MRNFIRLAGSLYAAVISYCVPASMVKDDLVRVTNYKVELEMALQNEDTSFKPLIQALVAGAGFGRKLLLHFLHSHHPWRSTY